MSTEDEGRSQPADNTGDEKAYFFNLAHETKQAQLLAINLEQKLFKILANQCQPQVETEAPLQAEKEQPSQYLRGNTLLLPHFTEPLELSHKQARVIKHSWGKDSSPPPVVKWANVNVLANTGYHSFSNAFPAQFTNLFIEVSYGKYRLRRDP
jgi:hypothetical protein